MTTELFMIFLMCVYGPITMLFLCIGMVIVLGWLNE